MIDQAFWSGRRIFLTGHTGFKGSWLALWLGSMGAEVYGYALPPVGEPNLFELASVEDGLNSTFGDIRDLQTLRKAMEHADPCIIFHMAAQPLVRESYDDPVGTYATNVMGTVNVLEAARSCQSLDAIVSVTTDKCYENREWAWGYRENEPMGGHDPYSNSKACAELVSLAYRRSFFAPDTSGPALATARAGNVIGGGDWSRDRLVPDILRAFEAGERVPIRNPRATRPWQHVLEPLGGYLMLAQSLVRDGAAFAEGWNFGPRDEDVQSVSRIAEMMAKEWGGALGWAAAQGYHPHEANALKLDISKARTVLGWEPRWTLEHTLRRIVEWHKAFIAGDDMRAHCLGEIADYSSYRHSKENI